MKILLCFSFVGLALSLRYNEMTRFNTATVTTTEDDDYYYMTSTGLPVHEYDDDVNRNDATAQSYSWTIPKNPIALDTPSCIPMGPTGFSLDGVPFFSAYTSGGLDAVLTETFDSCEGHSAGNGAYHYHQMSSCIFPTNRCPPNKLVGVALDGIPIYGPCDSSGTKLTHSDLDDCNGHTTTFTRPNGSSYTQYVYRITEDFPYSMHCYTYVVPNKNYADGVGSCPTRKRNVHSPNQNDDNQASILKLLKELLNVA